VDKDGNASIPGGPGLGVEIDEKRMEKVAKDPKTARFQWPKITLRDGSVADC
jgi:hypothetical protein